MESETQLIQQRITEFHQKELKNYMSLALSAIKDDYSNEEGGREEAQRRARKTLKNLKYANDGYFFATDRVGNSLVNRIANPSEKVNYWNAKDATGSYFTQELMAKAINGGGFHVYQWEKPSTNTATLKMSYATFLPKWGWMIGTGVYLDDVNQQVSAYKNDISLETRKAETILFLGTLFTVILAAVAIAAVHYNEHKLADARLKALTRRIVDVQEEERKRVAHDLHDGINQLLVSIRYRLEMAIEQVSHPDKALDLLTKSLGILDTTISDVRRISKALHPSALDNIGLSVAIRELAHGFQDSTSIKTRALVATLDNRLSDRAKIALYRVTQEALTNVSRHAKAREVEIELGYDDDNRTVFLRISDDGEGLKPPEQTPATGGLGLRNMLERIEAQGGNLEFSSGALGGLELRAIVPQE
ncbi:cache domain-containing protein [Cohaesibacter sp. ES.047]|uniref:cache domain-containing protein n=1 Tax=Cohaesibacter sp. ES.047 TaxID=1798205 RepID=UPI0015616359|nr:cache domain-containing protein [Cohaesibacter sp. ES.047]